MSLAKKIYSFLKKKPNSDNEKKSSIQYKIPEIFSDKKKIEEHLIFSKLENEYFELFKEARKKCISDRESITCTKMFSKFLRMPSLTINSNNFNNILNFMETNIKMASVVCNIVFSYLEYDFVDINISCSVAYHKDRSPLGGKIISLIFEIPSLRALGCSNNQDNLFLISSYWIFDIGFRFYINNNNNIYRMYFIKTYSVDVSNYNSCMDLYIGDTSEKTCEKKKKKYEPKPSVLYFNYFRKKTLSSTY